MTTSNKAKLLKHARKYSVSCKKGAVLRRYASQAFCMDQNELARNVCHVCAWVSLACPLDEAAVVVAGSSLSPLRVLLKMLRLLRPESMSTRLTEALQCVQSACDVVLESLEGNHHDCWIQLRGCLKQLSRDKAKHVSTSINGCAGIDHGARYDVGNLAQLKRVRRLHARICKWSNADHHERQELCLRHEERFAQLLQTEFEDVAALRKIIYDLIGALSPPRRHVEACNVLVGYGRDKQHDHSLNLQQRIRHMLILAIHAWRLKLWLEEVQIEPILTQIKTYISSFERAHGSLNDAIASIEWAKLRLAVGCSDENDGVQIDSLSDTLRTSVSCEEKHEEKHGVFTERPTLHTPSPSQSRLECRAEIHETYTPSSRIQSMPTVFYRPTEPKKLKCEECGYVISSAWYFLHPRVQAVAVLKPNNGHAACRRALKRLARFETIDGSRSTVDSKNTLDFCEHKVSRTSCLKCGAIVICRHGKRKQNCKECHVLVKFHKKPGQKRATQLRYDRDRVG